MSRSVCWLVVVTFAGVMAGCKDFGVQPQPSTSQTPSTPGVITISFASDVLPILTNAGCVTCHGGNGGLVVGTVPALFAGGDHGPAIVTGKADSSNLVRKLLTPPPFGSRMPLGLSPLPESSITIIKNWINQGALNN